jgi:hypothetical protein
MGAPAVAKKSGFSGRVFWKIVANSGNKKSKKVANSVSFLLKKVA